jgi:O-antigen/teichoic acid export membrane protein
MAIRLIQKLGAAVRPRAADGGIFARLAKNLGWLLGSRGFTGVASLAYLAIAARSLGPIGFGAFTLVLTYGQLITNLVQFQSWKSVIRYGAVHITEKKPDRLARLFGFTATLDWASGLLGGLVAVLAVPLVTPLLHWDAAQQQSAQWFSVALLLTTSATPSGVLRLFDRFDLLAYTDALAPAVRLIGSIAAWVTGAGVGTFLVVWAVAAAIQMVAQWIAALRLQCARPQFGRHALVAAVHENPRIWRFMVQTNISSSLSVFGMQLGTLAVGGVAGPVEAGGFRISQRLAKGITNPIETVTRALYPEFARLVAEDDHAKLRQVLVRVCSISAALAAVVVVATGPAAAATLQFVAGANFAFASEYLFILLIAAAIDLAGFALEPFLSAHGRAGRVLRIRAVGAFTFLVLLGLLLPILGATGAALAAVGASVIIFAQSVISSLQILRKAND